MDELVKISVTTMRANGNIVGGGSACIIGRPGETRADLIRRYAEYADKRFSYYGRKPTTVVYDYSIGSETASFDMDYLQEEC